MSRSRERSRFLLSAALLFGLGCGDGILVARELAPEDEDEEEPAADASASQPEDSEPSQEFVSERHRVRPRPTRHPSHHDDFSKKHLRDAGTHTLDD